MDADCNDAQLCTLDRCVANKCQRARFSDSPAVHVPLAPGAEVVLGPGARVLETVYDGTSFLVVWRDGAGNVRGRRVSDAGAIVDAVPWALPSDLASIAFDGTKYMALRNVLDDTSYTIVPHAGFITQSGNVGSFWPLDLYCRNASTYCAAHQVVYGAGNFLVLYAPASWRDVSYMLYDTGGNLVQQVDLLRHVAMYPRADFDGSKFAVVWDDFRDISNAASIYGAHVKPGGGNQPFSGHVPLFTENPPSDLNASGVATITSGASSYVVTFNGFRDPQQVRRMNKSWGVDATKITSVGPQFDINTRPTVFDGKNFIVSSSTCVGANCWASAGVYASRIDESGAAVDPKPVALAPVGSNYPKLATSRKGKNLVAYERGGAVIARAFDTCP